MIRDAAEQEKYATTVDIIRQIALTGCRRSEMIGLKWTEADTEASCLRLEDSKGCRPFARVSSVDLSLPRLRFRQTHGEFLDRSRRKIETRKFPTISFEMKTDSPGAFFIAEPD
jgi:integrase